MTLYQSFLIGKLQPKQRSIQRHMLQLRRNWALVFSVSQS